MSRATISVLPDIAVEYWRDSAKDWLRIAADQAIISTKLFCCKCAEESLDKMDAAASVETVSLSGSDFMKESTVPAAIG